MTTIAQLTDLHLLEDDFDDKRTLGERARLSYLSFGRRLDPADRRERLRRSLAEVRAAQVDHVILTGDLTEDGHPAQFELLAEVLADSRIPADRVTIVPGNHDAYGDGSAYEAAMAGPLRAYAPTSGICNPIPLRDATLVPVSTAFQQTCLRSAGAISEADRAALARIVTDPAFLGKPLIFAQHHHPGQYLVPIWQWIDGMLEHRVFSYLFEQCPHLYVVHGHTHRAVDKAVRRGEPARIFSATAVVDSDEPLRLYQASASGLLPLASDVYDGVGALALSA
jgi:3',5'-cyclic AMP phosphodiesterase CpdA